MGAWSTGPFENDEASDFVYVVEESRSFDVLEEKLDEVIASQAEEASAASEAVAAATIVAAARKGDRSELPDEVSAWVAARRDGPSAALIEKAAQALRLILEAKRSELRQLWEENTEEYGNWRASIERALNKLE